MKSTNSGKVSRRKALKSIAVLPLMGMAGRDLLTGNTGIDPPTVSLQELKGVLPKGKLGKHQISRLVIGSNPINGFAHSRDLNYVGSLFRAYNTQKKVFENGADFVNAGMLDFQLINNINLVTDILNNLPRRKRGWFS